jgi:hypothetical protein
MKRYSAPEKHVCFSGAFLCTDAKGRKVYNPVPHLNIPNGIEKGEYRKWNL